MVATATSKDATATQRLPPGRGLLEVTRRVTTPPEGPRVTRPPICAALSIPVITKPRQTVAIENIAAAPNIQRNSYGSICCRSRHNDTNNAPYTPKMAPDAPPDTA